MARQDMTTQVEDKTREDKTKTPIYRTYALQTQKERGMNTRQENTSTKIKANTRHKDEDKTAICI
jgi:hypothetical protein